MMISTLRRTAVYPVLALALAGCQSQGTDRPSVTDPSEAEIGNPMAALPDNTAAESTDESGDEADNGADAAPKDEASTSQPDPDAIEPTAGPVYCGALDPADRAALLERMNDARAEARQCGTERYPAVPALVWDSRLEEAANVHSADMARNDFFSHTGSDGSAHSDRVDRAGYSWSTVGENIAAGQGNADVAIEGWLDSPGHCRNLMSSSYRAVGMACVEDGSSRYSTYWTQVFAAPR